jgi:hypothetical protein
MLNRNGQALDGLGSVRAPPDSIRPSVPTCEQIDLPQGDGARRRLA